MKINKQKIAFFVVYVTALIVVLIDLLLWRA